MAAVAKVVAPEGLETVAAACTTAVAAEAPEVRYNRAEVHVVLATVVGFVVRAASAVKPARLAQTAHWQTVITAFHQRGVWVDWTLAGQNFDKAPVALV